MTMKQPSWYYDGTYCRCCGTAMGDSATCPTCGCADENETCPTQDHCRDCGDKDCTINHRDPDGYDAAYHREMAGE